MLLPFLLLIAGLAILVVGAEALVRGASGIARAAGLTPLVIGLTVVAFGTSSPELAVSLKASLTGNGGLVTGNIVGSNIFNVAVILGLSSLIFPLRVHLQLIWLDMPVMLGASAVFVFFCRTGLQIQQWEGALLFTGVIAYTIFIIRLARRESKAVQESVEVLMVPAEKPKHLWLQMILAGAGVALLIFGAQILVDNATLIARNLGVSDVVIGLTLVAAGTSLPELATSLVAAFRKETDMAIGNIVGSNIFNVLCVGGAAAMAAPVDTSLVNWLDLGAMLATSLLLLPLMRSGFRISRWEGALLVAAYGTYVFLRWP